MMFDQIRDTLANNGKSGVAYAKVVTLIETAMKEDRDHAAGYMVLKVLAERFIESTGRLPITVKQAENSFDSFVAHLSDLKDAYAAKDDTAILKTLNSVSVASLEPFDASSPSSK